MLRNIVLAFVLLTAVYSSALAQGNVTFSGVGRAEINSTVFNGNLSRLDTFNPERSLDGRTLLDLGITFKPNAVTEIKGVTRFNNGWGGFFGQDLNARLRELYVKGVVGGKFRYQVGDLDEKLTPYTFWNNGFDLSTPYSAQNFKDYEDIIAYENFYMEPNTWRQQGIKADFGLTFDQFLEGIDFKGYVTKNRDANLNINLPTTIFAGAQALVKHPTIGTLGFNWANMYDLDETVLNAAGQDLVRNPVLSGSYDLGFNVNENFKIGVVGEAGISRRSYQTVDVDLEGSFYDVGLKGELKSLGLNAVLSYFNVDENFRSPGAQSRTINFQQSEYPISSVGFSDGFNDYITTANNPTLFSTFVATETSGQLPRNQNLLDLTRDYLIYNRSLSRSISEFDYNPHYNNVNPYGKATPNRKGINLDLSIDKSESPLALDFNAIYAQENIGVNTSNTRDFLKLKGGAKVMINQLYGGKKKLQLNLGGIPENTQREGDGNLRQINLTTRVYEAGLNFEVFKNLELLGGSKYIFTSGNEFINKMDEFTRVSNDAPSEYNYYLEESLFGGGLKYNFSDFAYVKVEYLTSYLDADIIQRNQFDYNMDQLLFLFNMKF